MPFKCLNVERDGAVERVVLNRPDVRNAFDDETIRELTWWADSVANDRSVRVAILSGAGRAFSAGADLRWMAKVAGYSHAENLEDAAAAARLFQSLDRLPIPTIARVQGAALGGGAGLCAACDIVVAAEDAVFGFTEVKLGLIPAVISPFVLAKIGRSAARELFLTGGRFGAARAREIGLVHAIVPADELDARVNGYVAELLAAGPEAIAAAKGLIADVARRVPGDAMMVTSEAIAARRASAEGQEGLRAFLEKRSPSWMDDGKREP
jgi:methylglutaconyl-CoA hydratase